LFDDSAQKQVVLSILVHCAKPSDIDSLEEGMEDIIQKFRKSRHSFLISLAWQRTTKLLEKLEKTQGQAQQSVDSIH